MALWENARHETRLIPQACEASVNSDWGLWCDTVIKQVALISHTASPKLLLRRQGARMHIYRVYGRGKKKPCMKDILYSV